MPYHASSPELAPQGKARYGNVAINNRPYFLHRDPSKANIKRLFNLRILKYYLRIIISLCLSYIIPIASFTMYFPRLVCTFQDTIEMYRAPHRADGTGTHVPESHCILSRREFSPARSVTHYRSVVGG